MGKAIRKYHKFLYRKKSHLVLLEPIPKNYFWLSIYVENRYQGKSISVLIIDYALSVLKGTHYIHFSHNIHTLKKIAKERKWTYQGKSDYIEGCVYYTCKANHVKKAKTTDVTHDVLKRLPQLKNYVNMEEVKIIVTNIINDL